MDPITTAIVAALPALATGAIKDAYEGLKTVIRRRWGETAPVSKAIAAVEEKPESKGRADVLQEELKSVKADTEQDVLKAVHDLVEQMKAGNVGGQAVAGIQFTVTGGTFTGITNVQSVTAHEINIGKSS